mmetsp:Transcript_2109/g.6253  ORF Transcript_2109/g.6253 Transcript_2109/m.6253 type:complete len:324 (+) Transcript_2109:49-1020(+)
MRLLVLLMCGAAVRGFVVSTSPAARTRGVLKAAEAVAPPPPQTPILDGKTDLEIGAFTQQSVAGVYVVRDASAAVRYVGASRDVALAVESHRRRFGADVAATVRVLQKDAELDDLEKMRRKVLDTFSTIPPGNADPKLGWEEIVSPFANGGGTAAVSQQTQSLEFTRENVDVVLDAVRPLLVADGGNVDVVSVDPRDKSVVLSLQGACGSCPSATTTMKNGLEKALRNAWPDLGPVSRVDDPTLKLTAQAADALLDPIRPAFTSLGATATVLSANLLGPGVVELEYAGPDNVRYGIELSLLASPLVTDVRWLAAVGSDVDDND